MTAVDTTTYNKARLYKPGTGYSRRAGSPSSLVVHTTNGQRGSSFAAEANFIYRSTAISSHDLIGKQGQIVQFLDAGSYVAWHAGVALAGFVNTYSIGIECHHSVGDTWTSDQRAALTERVKHYIERFGIAEHMIETHRKVALPAGRKVDPSDWPDADFYSWRASLFAAPAPQPPQGGHTYRVRAGATAVVREAPQRPPKGHPDNIALGGTARLAAGTVVVGDGFTQGETVGGDARWLHLADGTGFVHISALEA